MVLFCNFRPSNSSGKPSPIGPLVPNLLSLQRNALSKRGIKRRIDYREANAMYHRDIFGDFLQWVKQHHTRVSGFNKFSYEPELSGLLDVEKFHVVQQDWHPVFTRENFEKRSFVDSFLLHAKTRYPEMQTMGFVPFSFVKKFT